MTKTTVYLPRELKRALVAQCGRIMERYADLAIGLADASVVVLADRHRTLDLLCTDARHFRSLRGAGGKAFRLLPLDASP